MTTNYESMTDGELSDILGVELGMDMVDRNPQDIPYASGGFAHKDYATSLDACRDAIEKFCERKGHHIDISYEGNGNWSMIVTVPSRTDHPDNIYFVGESKNPARAACIAMLKAMEK